jgi:hypothetical protein
MPTCYWGSEGTVEQESLLCELREDLLTGSRELGVRRTHVVGVTGKGQALILASFKFCSTTQGAKSASIILILLSHFELHCWWHTIVNVLVTNRPSLEWLLLRQLAYPRDTCCRQSYRSDCFVLPLLVRLMFYSDTVKDVITKYRVICWSCRSGLSNIWPLVTWIVSVIQFNKYNIIGLQNITWQLY